MGKYTIFKLETHANHWAVVSFHSLVCLAIASLLIEFKTFSTIFAKKMKHGSKEYVLHNEIHKKIINPSFTRISIWNTW
jgi:hypothetical protein